VMLGALKQPLPTKIDARNLVVGEPNERCLAESSSPLLRRTLRRSAFPPIENEVPGHICRVSADTIATKIMSFA
jgi:hypothetical protein